MVMAQIYAMIGEYDKAIDELEYLLSIESWSTPNYLRAEPFFEPLQEIPRFKKLLARYEYMHKGS